METLMEVILSYIGDRILRPILMVLVACLLFVVLLRLVVLALEPIGEPVRPSLYYRPSSLSERLIRTLPALRVAYTVPGCWSLMNGNFGSFLILVATACTRWTGQVRFFREYLLMDDGGLVSLDWVQGLQLAFTFQNAENENNANTKSPKSEEKNFSWIVLLIPGQWVCDSKRNLQEVCRSLVDQGHQPIIWNRRGQAGTPLAKSSSSSLFSGCRDLRQVIQYLSVQNPNLPLALVGFSHSASLLISYLGEFGSSSLIHSAIAVSPLWQHPQTGMEWIFSTCKGIQIDSESADPLRDSDDIAVPLLVIHYDDDPLVPVNTLPKDLFSLYPQLILVTCPLGGHCGQLQPMPRLVDVIIGDFIQEVLTFTSWPLSVPQQQGRRNRLGSLTRSSVSVRRTRRNNCKNGRPSCRSC